jgi:predicted nucleotidyltransferase
MIPPALRSEIAARLAALEAEECCRVLFAVESGSRAWGFPSTDSDYDVRFIYARPAEWYLSVDLEDKRDVIERPINDLIDLAGWDVRKALQLFAKTNPPLYEWLDSPIVYADDGVFANALRGLMPAFYSPIAAGYHYLRMAERTDKAYMQGELVKLKKYFYVLRPLLAVRWIEQGRGPVPMLFESLLSTIEGQSDLLAGIRDLLVRKVAGEELDEGPRIAVIDDFQRRELERLRSAAPSLPPVRGNRELLNDLFRKTVQSVSPR